MDTLTNSILTIRNYSCKKNFGNNCVVKLNFGKVLTNLENPRKDPSKIIACCARYGATEAQT